MSLKIGEAFDITVKPIVAKSVTIRYGVTDYDMKYELKNASTKDVIVNVYQSLAGYGHDYDFKKESHKGENKNDSSRVWKVKIPAEGSAELSYSVRETDR